MIEKRTAPLTTAEEAHLVEYRAQCLARGRAVGPVDRPVVEAGIVAMYKAIGMSAPQFVWADSPVGGLLLTVVRGELGSQLVDELGGRLGTQLRGQLWSQLIGRLIDQLSGQVGDQLSGQLRGRLESRIHNEISEQLRRQLDDQLWDQLSDQLRGKTNEAWWGQHYIGWMAWLNFARQIGVKYSAELDAGLDGWDAASDTGWFWPYKNVCVCTERPVAQHLDANGRLHHPSDMAMRFGDGYGFFVWHGVRVPDWVLTPSLEQIAAETNAEIRRCAIEAYGWRGYLDSLGSAPVAVCDDPANAPQVLELYDVPDGLYDGPVRLLVMTNGTVERDGTRRMYAETVPINITDPVDAAAWRVGLATEDYLQLAQRT